MHLVRLMMRSMRTSLASQWGIFMACGFRQIIPRGNCSSAAGDGCAHYDADDRGGRGDRHHRCHGPCRRFGAGRGRLLAGSWVNEG
jgi:hypothetical protein